LRRPAAAVAAVADLEATILSEDETAAVAVAVAAGAGAAVAAGAAGAVAAGAGAGAAGAAAVDAVDDAAVFAALDFARCLCLGCPLAVVRLEKPAAVQHQAGVSEAHIHREQRSTFDVDIPCRKHIDWS